MGHYMIVPGASHSKESAFSAGDLGLILGLGKSPGGRYGHPLQYSCLENPHGQRSLAGYGPWGRKELDMTEQLRKQHTKVKAENNKFFVKIKVQLLP